MTKSLEEANAGIRALEDEIIIIRDSPLSDKDIQARVNKVQDKLKILLRRRIEDLYPNFCIDIADIDERIRIGISLSNHYTRLNELIPENALEATSLADRFHEVNDELRELRKRKRGRISGGSINGLLQFDVFRSGMFGVAWCHMFNPDFSYSNITCKLRCEGLIPNLILEDGQKMITLSKEFLENSGVGLFHVADEEKTYCRTSLFLRSYCMDQIACIRDRILDKGSVGFIHGPPGTGKSIITYFFMALMSRKNGWRVVWVHFRQEADSVSPLMDCIIFSEGNKYSFEANEESLRKLFSEMSWIANQRVTVVLDGFKRIDEIYNIHAAARTWLQSNKEKCRIICISSLRASNRGTLHDDNAQKIVTFDQFSWTWAEYVEAINCPGFYEEVAPMLDAPSTNHTPLVQLAAKFFFAGASARYMFAYSTASVQNSIRESLSSTNLSTLIKDSGTSDAVNRLFKYFPESSGTFLSEFVHHTLTDMNAPEDIVPLLATGLAGTNAALREP